MESHVLLDIFVMINYNINLGIDNIPWKVVNKAKILCTSPDKSLDQANTIKYIE
jgi:hypothetical protein